MLVGIIAKPRGFALSAVIFIFCLFAGFSDRAFAADGPGLPPLPSEYANVLQKANKLFDDIEYTADDCCLTQKELDAYYAEAHALADEMENLSNRPDAHGHFSGWLAPAFFDYETHGWTPDGEMQQAMQDIWDLLDDIPLCDPPVTLGYGFGQRYYLESDPNRYAVPGSGAIQLLEPVHPYYHWSGLYVGAQVTGNISSVNTIEYLHATTIQTNLLQDTGGSPGGGIDVGYNFRPWRQVVVGVEAQLNGFHDDEIQHFSFGSIGSSVDFSGSVLFNGGYLVTPRLLLYGQAGVSVAAQNLQINFMAPATDTTKWTPGITAGFGGEFMLPRGNIPFFGAQTSLFMTYDHTWYDSVHLDAPMSSPSFDYKFTRKTNTLEFGLRAHF